jgi:hypothetical protein
MARRKKRNESLFDWLAQGKKPDALGYRTIDPQRWRAIVKAVREEAPTGEIDPIDLAEGGDGEVYDP